METERSRTQWWIYVLIVAGLVISCVGGLLLGGIGGYLLGRGQRAATESSRVIPSEKPERILPGLRTPVPVEPAFEYGAVVRFVEEGGPAAQAGLQVGDVITAVNGRELSPEQDLTSLIRSHQPGDRIEITFLRMEMGTGRARRTVGVTLGQRRDEQGRTVASLGLTYSSVTGRMFLTP